MTRTFGGGAQTRYFLARSHMGGFRSILNELYEFMAMLVLTNDSYVCPRLHTHELLKDNFIIKDNFWSYEKIFYIIDA